MADNENPNPEVQDNPGQSQEQKPWYEKLDNDLRENPSITKFKSEGDLAKSYVELQKTLGKDKVIVPNDKSTPEEWAAFWKKAGMPEKEEEYSADQEDMAEQVRLTEDQVKEFRKAAYAQGVSKKQFDAMFGTYKKLTNARLNQELDNIKGLRNTSETALRQEWGAAYEKKVDGAQKVIDTFFKDKGIRPEFSILANDKGFIKAMADIADKIGEDVILGKARITQTPQEAAVEFNSIMRDKKHPFFNELDPEHDLAVTKVADLQALMMSGQA
jgi:hypothetical protein